MFDLLSLTRDELWAIHDYVRQHDKLGQEWDKDFMTRVMKAIMEVQDNPLHTATLLIFLEDELWQIDRQVSSALMIGTQPVGRNLLIKAIRLILKTRQEGGDNDDPDTCKSSSENTNGGSYQATAP